MALNTLRFSLVKLVVLVVELSGCVYMCPPVWPHFQCCCLSALKPAENSALPLGEWATLWKLTVQTDLFCLCVFLRIIKAVENECNLHYCGTIYSLYVKRFLIVGWCG